MKRISINNKSQEKININLVNFNFWLHKLSEWVEKTFNYVFKSKLPENLPILATWDSADKKRKLFKIQRNTPGAIATYQLKFQDIPDRIQIGVDDLGELRRTLKQRQLELGENYKKTEIDIGIIDTELKTPTHRLWVQHIWRSPNTKKPYYRLRYILDFDAQQCECYQKAEMITQYVAIYFLNLYYPKCNPLIFALQENWIKVLVNACQKELGNNYLHTVIQQFPRDHQKITNISAPSSPYKHSKKKVSHFHSY